MQYENEDEDNNIVDLDDSWITDFENELNDYKNYYVEDIFYIKLCCIYIHDNEIKKVKEEKLYLKNVNQLTRDELIDVIKQNCIENNVKYSILYLLKYNIDLMPTHLKTFLKSNNTKQNRYLSSLSHISNVTFNPSISMFQKLNSLYIIFQLPDKNKDKINHHTKLNITKKRYIDTYAKNKTTRKQLKAKMIYKNNPNDIA